MKRLAFVIAFLIAGIAAALAQTTVSVVGPVTPGDCVQFSSITILKDAGVTCNGGGGGGTPGGSNGQVQFNNSGSFGGLTNVQLTALVQQFSPTLSGAVPASGGGTTNFLRADGSWVPPPAAGVSSFNARTGAVVPAAHDYSAGLLDYTAPGTGGVLQNIAAKLNTIGLWANDYGAVCNGVTDDHVAFQNAINEGQSVGIPVKFLGNCAITTALSIANTFSVDFSGDQTNSSLLPPGGIDAIDINTTAAIYLHDFTITYSSTPTTTSAITVSAPASTVNNASRFWNLTINSAFIGVNYLNADIWSLSNSVIASSGITNGSGVHVADSVNVDAGDNTIYGNLIQAGPGGIGVLWTSSGGLRFENNKINSNGAAVGIQFNLASGANTSDVIIANNSIEGFVASGSVGIGFARSGTTGSLSNVIIANNQIGGPMFCVLHPTDANGAWTNAITVNGNVCQLSSAANGVGVVIDSAQGVVVTNNNFVSGAATDIPTQIGTAAASATGCVVAHNPRIGTWSAGGSTVGTCTSAIPF
jgi:hypothetical protein